MSHFDTIENSTCSITLPGKVRIPLVSMYVCTCPEVSIEIVCGVHSFDRACFFPIEFGPPPQTIN